MTWEFPLAFTFLIGLSAIGDMISTKTRGKVPGVLFLSVSMLIGFWTGLPKDIVSIAKLDGIADVTMLFVLIHMGTLLDLRQMKKEWKTVFTVTAAILGILIAVGAAVIPIFGLKTFATVVPPLAGGGMAAIIMNKAAMAKGHTELAILAILMMLSQAFVATPIIVSALKKESSRLLEKYRSGDKSEFEENVHDENEVNKQRIVDRIPSQYKTTAFYLAKLGVLACINLYFVAPIFAPYISSSLTGLVIGIIVSALGLIDREPIVKAQSFGILMTAMFISLLGGLSSASPDLIMSLVVPISVSLATAVVGVYILSIMAGKRVGYSKHLSFAIGLNCFLGFPFNYFVTEEATKAVANGPEEQKILMDKLMPGMLVSGFVAVTIVSVVLAGLLSNLI